jgi:hypothetical protein
MIGASFAKSANIKTETVLCRVGGYSIASEPQLYTYPTSDTKCALLAVLLGLQTKPLDYSHSFIADYTRRYYNLSITVLSRRMYNMKYRPVDVLSP